VGRLHDDPHPALPEDAIDAILAGDDRTDLHTLTISGNDPVRNEVPGEASCGTARKPPSRRADQLEQLTKGQIAKLAADDALLDSAIAAANGPRRYAASKLRSSLGSPRHERR
jgi:hypothetical protein